MNQHVTDEVAAFGPRSPTSHPNSSSHRKRRPHHIWLSDSIVGGFSRYHSPILVQLGDYVHYNPWAKMLPFLFLCLANLACIFYADSVMQASPGPNSYSYSSIELANSASQIVQVVGSFDAAALAACGWSVGMHMFNVFMYSGFLTLLAVWTWTRWLRKIRLSDIKFLEAPDIAEPPPNQRTESATLDQLNQATPSTRYAGPSNADVAVGLEELHDRYRGCTLFALCFGNLVTCYQLLILPLYLFEHIGVLVYLLDASSSHGRWWQAITVFDIMFLVSIGLSLGYFLVSMIVFRCLSKRTHFVPQTFRRGPRGSL